PLLRNKLAELPDFAGAVGDLASIVGADSQEEIRRTVGLVLTTQSQARIQSLDAFRNAAPALAAVATTDSGDDRIRALREGGALFAAIGGAIKDPEGALTKTATAEVATALQELLPEKDIKNVQGDTIRKGTGLQTLGERLARLQGDETLQREFLQGSDTFQKASFRGPIAPVVAELISRPDSEAAKRFQTAFTKVQDDPEIVNQMLRNLSDASPQLQTAGISRQAASNIESMQLTPGAATRDAARDILKTTLEQTRGSQLGPDYVHDRAVLGAFDMGDGSPEHGVGLLRTRESLIRQRGGFLADLLIGDSPGLRGQRSDSELSAGELAQVELLQRNAQLLERMAAAAEATNNKL
ncbi:MAG: hypothetical protein KDA71_17220, partial [Planctomycetales bacterium]|nr:hypothetical protein [Planctomycetales bacterium]